MSTVSSLAFRSSEAGRLRNSRNRFAAGTTQCQCQKLCREYLEGQQTFTISERGLTTLRVVLILFPGHLTRRVVGFL